MFTEDAPANAGPRSGYAKDAMEVEGYVRGFGRRRPDVDLSVLRFTNFIGPRMDTPLTRYLSLPVVPTVLGFDPRVQLCHEDDGIEVLRRMTMASHPGIYNVGGPGVLLLSQAARRLGRPTVPVVSPAVSLVASALRRAGIVDVSAEQMRWLEHGRANDVSRLAPEIGFTPRPTADAFEDFARLSGRRRFAADAAEVVERRLLDLLVRRRAAPETASA